MISSSDDLRMLAEERLAEAQTLLAGKHFSGAYYLAGYAVELGLKAVLTKGLSTHAMPNLKDVQAAHIHDLRTLAERCGLLPEKEPSIRVAWAVVAPNWSPEDRYRIHSATRASDIVEAAGEVLSWLMPQW